MADGPVSKGTPIGYVFGYDSSVSTGPHVHVEFHTVPPPSWETPFAIILKEPMIPDLFWKCLV